MAVAGKMKQSSTIVALFSDGCFGEDTFFVGIGHLRSEYRCKRRYHAILTWSNLLFSEIHACSTGGLILVGKTGLLLVLGAQQTFKMLYPSKTRLQVLIWQKVEVKSNCRQKQKGQGWLWPTHREASALVQWHHWGCLLEEKPRDSWCFNLQHWLEIQCLCADIRPTASMESFPRSRHGILSLHCCQNRNGSWTGLKILLSYACIMWMWVGLWIPLINCNPHAPQ